jgi:hypothetical protein
MLLPKQTTEYMSEILVELLKLAAHAGLPTTAYLLDMAVSDLGNLNEGAAPLKQQRTHNSFAITDHGRSKMRRLAFALPVLFAMSGNAWAWGDTGHKTVCEIAFNLAAPDTQSAIRALLRNDARFRTFSESCTFPDHPHVRASEHFINLPRTSSSLTSDACPQAPKCLLTAIKNDSAIISSRLRRQDKLTALKFLGHWVGDIHQPLHISFEDDRGGNNITVSGRCSGKFHSSWDTCLLEKAIGTDVQAAGATLIASITPAMKAQWIASEPREWANESFAITEAVTTKYCVMAAGSCNSPSPAHITIDDAYVAMSAPIIRERLQRAGVRLADRLDKAFGN